jgi:hypothetical protein
VWVIDDSNKVIRTFPVTGRSGVPNPGSYKVFSQSLLTNSTAAKNVTMRYMTRFAHGPNGGNIGLHEIPKKDGRPLQTVEELGSYGSGVASSRRFSGNECHLTTSGADTGYMEVSDLVAKSRKLVTINKDEQNDNLVCDMTEIPTSFYARLYGKRGAANRAKRALEEVKPL